MVVVVVGPFYCSLFLSFFHENAPKKTFLAKKILISQYKTRPTGPVKYIKIKGTTAKLLEILYFTTSLETQDPKKRFKAKKCNQNINKKPSIENIV